MSDGIQAAHIDTGEKVRTNRGMTKFLIRIHRARART